MIREIGGALSIAMLSELAPLGLVILFVAALCP
jgi:hypothetical protein